jgi:hypothetical protein
VLACLYGSIPVQCSQATRVLACHDVSRARFRAFHCHIRSAFDPKVSCEPGARPNRTLRAKRGQAARQARHISGNGSGGSSGAAPSSKPAKPRRTLVVEELEGSTGVGVSCRSLGVAEAHSCQLL